MTLSIDLAEAGRFLDLFGEGEPHAFQWFDDTKKTGRAGHGVGHLVDIAAALCDLNRRYHCGIYFMVNAGDGSGRNTDSVTAVRALFVDLDGAPLAPVQSAPLSPHAIVESSPGRYQAYWLVGDCPKERFRGLQVAMAARFGGDASVKDLPRVMRVPGFYHQKTATPFRVRVVELDEFLPYPVDEVVRALGLQEPESTPGDPQLLPNLDGLAPGSIQPGDRHETLLRFAVRHAKSGYTRAEVLAFVQGINHTYCSQPKPLNEVTDIVDFAMNQVPPKVDLTGLLGKKPAAPAKEDRDRPTELAIPERFLSPAPGLVGVLARWILSAVPRHQPHFAFAAALAFVGALKGHRVQTPRRTRTNHMTLAIGKSGSGKSQVGDRIEDVIRCAGLDKMAMGIPASDSALRSALSGRSGRAYLYWDEIGLALEGMLSKNAQYHFRAIKDLMVELWTKPHAVLRRKELISQESQKAHVDIDQPCFGMYATAQPDIFYGALSGAHAADGFYPRLLVFETPDNYPAEKDVTYSDPPERLVAACRWIQEDWPTNAYPSGGNLDGVNINPRIIPFSPAAQRMLDAFRKDIERRLAGLSDSLESGIWARALTHAEKIALTVEDADEITADTTAWAIDLVSRLSPAMASAFQLRVSDTAVEKTKKRVLQVIAAAGERGIPTNLLTRRTQFLRDKRERDVVLSELYDSGQITKQEDPVPSGRAVVRWVLSGLAS